MWIFTKRLLRFIFSAYTTSTLKILSQTNRQNGYKMDRFLSHFLLAIRASSDIIRSAAPRVLYLINHSCSYIKYYLYAFTPTAYQACCKNMLCRLLRVLVGHSIVCAGAKFLITILLSARYINGTISNYPCTHCTPLFKTLTLFLFFSNGEISH